MITPEQVTHPATNMPGPGQGNWTYESYAALPNDGNRYEVIGGILFVSPSPSPRHQRLLVRLVGRLSGYVEEHDPGEVFQAPLDLVMPGTAPVQPDAFVFLGTNVPEFDESRPPVTGVPDLVIEVMSPSTAGYDRREKQDACLRAGVREYWPVDQDALTTEVLVLEDGKYRSRSVVRGESRVPSSVLPDLPFPVSELLGRQATTKGTM